MGTISLDSIFDKIVGYEDTLKENGYINNGSGKLPWSTNYKHENGTSIDVRGSDWTMYDTTGSVITSGRNHIDLKRNFLSTKTKDELIDLLLK